LNNGIPPYFIIKENSLNCHEHYNAAIELCVMIIPFLLYSAAFLLCARNFVSANIGLPAKEAGGIGEADTPFSLPNSGPIAPTTGLNVECALQ
jgi:hypothetical protein